MRSAPWDESWGPPPARETVSAAVYRRLRDAILAGRIRVGVKINELELASAWKISRTPIRDALRRLEAEGLVQALPGRGMIVPTLSRAEVQESYEVREVLEGLAARRAAQLATATFLGRLNALIKGYGAAVKQADMEQLLAVDDEFHAAIIQMAQSRKLEQAINSVRVQLHRFHARSFYLKGRAAKSFREKARLVAAIRSRDPVKAEASMREHLASLRADITESLEELEAVRPI